MTTPNIRYYARLEDCTGNGKTPKYVITAQAGAHSRETGCTADFLLAIKED